MSSLQDSHLVYMDNPGGIPATYRLPGSLGLRLESIYAEFSGASASGPWLACLELLSQDGKVVGRYFSDQQLGVGDDAHVTWAPFLGRTSQAAQLTLNPNLGEIGHATGTTLGTTQTMTVAFQDALVGDQIMVLAFAPSRPVALGATGSPTSVADSKGSLYFEQLGQNWEALPPNANEGIRYRVFVSTPISSPLVAGTDSITVTWNNPVYDRSVLAWLVRYPGGIDGLFGLGGTTSNNAAVRASAQVTRAPNNFTPRSEAGFEFAVFILAYPGGAVSFSAVPGFDGFYQARGELIVGSQQTYLCNWQTHEADVYLRAGSSHATFEDDIGLLPAGVLVPSFNGAGQTYSVGAGNWKGVFIIGFPYSQ